MKNVFRSPLFWILFFVIAEFGINFEKWATPFLGEHGADPASYVSASYNIVNLLHGDVDIARPPVYPAFIAFCRLLAGEQHALELTVILQRIIGIVSLAVLYLICQFFFRNRYLPAAATVLYAALMIFLRRFDTWIMSEPLSMSFTVFFFYMLISYSRKAAYWNASLIGLSVFVFVMLRPAFLVFVPVVFVYWCGNLSAGFPANRKTVFQYSVFQEERLKYHIAGLSATLLSVLLILGYSCLVYQKSGIFQVSAIAFYNQFMCVIQSGITKNGADPQMNDRIQECLEEFKQKYPNKLKKPDWMFDREVDACNSPLGYVQYAYPLVSPQNESVFLSQKAAFIKIKDYTTQTLKKNKLDYARYIIKKMFLVSFSEKRVGAVYAALAGSAVVLLFSLRKQEPMINWLHFICWSLTFVMVFASMAASYTSYGRIILPVLALALIQIFLIIDRISALFNFCRIDT